MQIRNVTLEDLEQARRKANAVVNREAIKFWKLRQRDKIGEDFALHLVPAHKSMFAYDRRTNTRFNKVSWLAYRLFLDALFDIAPHAVLSLNAVRYNGREEFDLNYRDPIDQSGND